MTDSPLHLTVHEILDLYRRKKLSPVDVTRAAHAQVLKHNPSLNAYVLIAEEKDLLRAASESEARWMKSEPQGVLDGIPMSIKDGYDVKGWPTREGSRVTSSQPKTEDSLVTTRLRAAGAIFLGKTAMPEFGLKGVTHGLLSGVTRNPWNTDKTTGGSSGGDGAAAAARMGFLHLGSDGGGSIRIPAAFCGVFGIKPSAGLVPGWPPSPFATLASAGPLARNVADAALMLDVITTPEARSWQALPARAGSYTDLSPPTRGLRAAWAPTINGTPIHPDIARLTADAARKFEAFGTVEEIALDLPNLVETFNMHWMSIAAWILDQIPKERHRDLDPYVLYWAERGKALSLNQFLSAETRRLEITAQMNELLSRYDVLLLPTMAMPAFDAGRDSAPDASGGEWRDWTPLTFPANLARLPAASLPCGVTRDGLPAGLQVVGGFLRENAVLAACHALEGAIGFRDWLSRREAPETRRASA